MAALMFVWKCLIEGETKTETDTGGLTEKKTEKRTETDKGKEGNSDRRMRP